MPYTHKGDRLWLNADKTKVVKDGDPDAAFLFVVEGDTVSDEDAERYGLNKKSARAESDEGEKARPEPSNKARAGGSENKVK